MCYKLYTLDNGRKTVARRFDTLEIALDMLKRKPFSCHVIEEDEDNPGYYDCFDCNGTVLCLEPAED